MVTSMQGSGKRNPRTVLGYSLPSLSSSTSTSGQLVCGSDALKGKPLGTRLCGGQESHLEVLGESWTWRETGRGRGNPTAGRGGRVENQRDVLGTMAAIICAHSLGVWSVAHPYFHGESECSQAREQCTMPPYLALGYPFSTLLKWPA